MGAFRGYCPIYCFGHRLNNILKELVHQKVSTKMHRNIKQQRTPPDKVENRPLLIYRSGYARSIEHVVLHIPTCFVSLNTLTEKKSWVDYFLYVIYGHFQLDSHALL